MIRAVRDRVGTGKGRYKLARAAVRSAWENPARSTNPGSAPLKCSESASSEPTRSELELVTLSLLPHLSLFASHSTYSTTVHLSHVLRPLPAPRSASSSNQDGATHPSASDELDHLGHDYGSASFPGKFFFFPKARRGLRADERAEPARRTGRQLLHWTLRLRVGSFLR